MKTTLSKALSCLVLLSLALPPLFAGDIKIDGAEKPVPQYTYAELSIKLTPGDKVAWHVLPQPTKKTDRGDGWLQFSGPPGATYTVVVTIVNFKEERLEKGETSVTFAGAPVPPPNPDPPGPGPSPKPDGKLGLSKASRDGAAQVTDPNKVDSAKKLASAQRGHASAVAAGAYDTASTTTLPSGIVTVEAGFNKEAALEGWRQKNNGAVDKAVWAAWGNTVSSAFLKLHKDGKIPNKADWVDAFNEIADGLDR